MVQESIVLLIILEWEEEREGCGKGEGGKIMKWGIGIKGVGEKIDK